MRKTFFVGIAVVLIGCGGGGGEPIEGTITIDYGGDMIAPDVGAALHQPDSPPNLMFIMIGTNEVDCGVDFETFDANGHFVLFEVDNTAPATHADTSITVVKSSSTELNLNLSSGTVVIDAIGAARDERITGSITFSTTDNEVGTIAVDGTFDVIRCF